MTRNGTWHHFFAAVAAIAALAVAGCATDGKSTFAAGPKCEPPPKQLVKKDIDPGTGDTVVTFRAAVLVGYTGWLYDDCKPDHKGEQFDTSANRQTPFGLVVGAGRVIKGWDEGLIGMKENGKRLLIIPPDKAYGDKQMGPIIKPNSTLVFEVQIVKILQPGEPPAKQ